MLTNIGSLKHTSPSQTIRWQITERDAECVSSIETAQDALECKTELRLLDHFIILCIRLNKRNKNQQNNLKKASNVIYDCFVEKGPPVFL